ncbi:MAG: 4Fe-4S dicluster domain-containing protein [Desulfuromonas sp.]|nr:4Fe-4S dicluster domain-containing protein [Desulfuromonas sp.]
MAPDFRTAGRPHIEAHCTGCGACVAACPERALSLAGEHPDGRGRKRAVVAAARCTNCGACLPACPRGALVLTEVSLKIELCK